MKNSLSPKEILLVGSPNSGKTTLFNWLTGLRYRAVNYPGSTVEVASGSMKEDPRFMIHDTPGVYSLLPQSEDERITVDMLLKKAPLGSLIVAVIDGTQLIRHLLIVKQLQEMGIRCIVAVTMADLLKKARWTIDIKAMETKLNCPVFLIDGSTAEGIEEPGGLVSHFKSRLDLVSEGSSKFEAASTQSHSLASWTQEKRRQVQVEIKEIIQAVLTRPKTTDRPELINFDQYLLNPFLGPIFFLLMMSVLFSSIFWLAKPLMDLISSGFALGGNILKTHFADFFFVDFLTDGVLGGAGAVLVFVPQIFILFFGVGLLESSGYLARAATLIDKPFHLLGMSGRSFVPLLSGFACAVPAMMASRNLGSKRDRWITNFIIPLMTCSARLPVFALLLGLLFYDQPAWKPGLAMALIYAGSLTFGGIAAAILNRFLNKDESSFFLMELPPYRGPRIRALLVQSFHRTKSYVLRAGPTIFFISLLIWTGIHFPSQPEGTPQNVQIEKSWMGQFGKLIEPAVKPLGLDWRVGIGLLTAFTAREVFVSTTAILFHQTSRSDAKPPDGETAVPPELLVESLKNAVDAEGKQIFQTSSVLGLIVFFMIALQCLSTVAISAKENNSWPFAITQLVLFNVIAYVFAWGAAHLV